MAIMSERPTEERKDQVHTPKRKNEGIIYLCKVMIDNDFDNYYENKNVSDSNLQKLKWYKQFKNINSKTY